MWEAKCQSPSTCVRTFTDGVRWRVIEAQSSVASCNDCLNSEELDTQGKAVPSARVRLTLTQQLGAVRLGRENAKHHAWSGR